MGNIGFDNDSEHKSVTSNLTSKNASNVTLQDSDQDQQSQSEYSGESSSESTSHTTKLPTMSANAVSIDSLDEDANVAEFDKLMQERQAKKKKRVIRRIIIAVIVVALIVGFMVYRALQPSKDAEAVAIPTSKVETGHFLDQVSSTGSIEPISSTMVTAQIDGTIGEVKVQEGAQVNAGDVLFTINNDKLDQDVNQADLAVRAAESGVNTAQTQVNQMNASLAAARQQGGSEGDVAASDVSDQLASAQGGLTGAQIALEQAQATYNQAVAELGKRTVTAPVSGTVLTLNAVPGASVSGSVSTDVSSGDSKPLCQISDLSQMKVNVNVNELDITKVDKDQEGTVTFSAISGLTLAAKVDTIASTTSQSDTSDSTSGQGSGSTGYAVRLIIPSPDPRLKSGMTANAKITTQSMDNAVMVPATALDTDKSGKSFVKVETNATTQEFKRVNVNVTAKNDTKAAVEGNLAKGDKVMINASQAESADGESN